MADVFSTETMKSSEVHVDENNPESRSEDAGNVVTTCTGQKRSASTRRNFIKKAKIEDVPKKVDATGKIPDISHLDFNSSAKTADGKQWNLKISSWNTNGIRAWIKKNGASFIEKDKPDVFCIQETKCPDDKIPANLKDSSDYYSYWLAGERKGYSGVGILSKLKPLNVSYGIGIEKHDKEGRVITAEYALFYLVNAYFPNAGKKLVKLQYRMEWDKDFREYLHDLDNKKPVILCGDLNVAHEEIDIANPEFNQGIAGYTQEEKDGFSKLLLAGYIDSFRTLHPVEKGAYTSWNYSNNARANNSGWRLDYFLISSRLQEQLCESAIRQDVHGSDHCPITLFLAM